MDPTAALVAGLIAGLAVAMQGGAGSLLLVEAAVAAGPRAGVAAGMGVATVDFGFAAIAAVAGGVAGPALAGYDKEIRIVGARARHVPRGRGPWRGAAGTLRALPGDHGGEPAHDRVVRGGRRRVDARRAGLRRRVCRRRRCGVRGLARRADGHRRSCRTVDHAADPARARDRR